MEMLTAKRVYAGKTISDSLAGVLAREPEWDDLPEDTPRSILRLLERCMEKEVTERLQVISEARIAIKRYLEEPEADEVAAVPDTTPQPAWRRTLPWAVAAAALAVAVVASFWPDASEPPQPPLRLSVNLPGEETLFRDRTIRSSRPMATGSASSRARP